VAAQTELLHGALWPGKDGWPIETGYLRVSKGLRTKRGCGKEKLREEGCCRMCQRPNAIRPLTRHHYIPCRWFRRHPEWRLLRDCDPNLAPLCWACHEDVELSDWNGGLPYRRMLRKVMSQDEIAFIIQVRGLEWLEHRYPMR
jgi:hypothetical protein